MAELQGLQRKSAELAQYGAKVFGIVVDPVSKNAEVVQELGLSYSVLADPELRVIDAYDLRHQDGGPEGTVARSATFVIDKDGVVRWRDLTESYRLRPSAEEVAAVVANLG